MNFYFSDFPQVKYYIKKNGKVEFLTNITLRYKILEVLKTNESGYYTYSISDGENAEDVAFNFYEDPKLSWIIFLVNNIYDPHYDWPLSYNDLIRFIRKKYGSIPEAQSTVHEYRKIIKESEVLFDGTIIPKKTYVIDETTYNTLSVNDKELISKYDYEVELNDSKRNIKLISPDNLRNILSEIREIFNG